ncbi:MAG: LysM peptidoglycan-binding domain-containing protein [Nitrospira sp.]|nr:LysM peptidoglycan-binding domain-containing protein [Nitrospira sp.]
MGVWILWFSLGGMGLVGCGPLEPIVEQEVSDLQLTVDTLKTSLRDSQRTITELRSELESRRQELADSQIARAQMEGRIREAERRLTEARHIIDLQREELTSSRTERQRVSQAGAALQNQLKQLQKQLAKMGKQFERGGETGAAPANLSSATTRPSAVRPVTMESSPRGVEIPRVAVAPLEALPSDASIDDGEDSMAAASHPTSLSVKPGDTLWGIAKRFHTTVQDLMAANELTGTRILIGQAIRLPRHVASETAPLDKAE